MNINLNDSTLVTLTEAGAASWNRWESQFENLKYTSPKYKVAGEVIEAPLWHLFQVFGSDVYMGGDVPFEYCSIAIDTKEAA